MPYKLKRNNRALFFYKFWTDPKQIGSITPSSRFLAKKIVDQVNWEQAETIVELGAGTGVFTKYISQNAKNGSSVLIIEQDFYMREKLKKEYPSFYFASNAEELTVIMDKMNLKKADAVISGLPFANFSDESRTSIMNEVKNSLQEDGAFVGFQYSFQMKEMLKAYYNSVSFKFVPLNIPPAFVYTCKHAKMI
ncbi:methyltransferase domain-containing protein [Bacillus lacus]|uniref:Methyltransferase domain-containing protein n=1 Tax=Metabacillus lacus TaxID=1983721 RepID=A0A7X2IW93_9BACI|nr:rRNA adenine N-6-methyltransferase family protein [Metabacillus lacus]MRX70780.1 methyltransferase domain-containing protein [Metabacillus lacus]